MREDTERKINSNMLLGNGIISFYHADHGVG